MGGVGGGSLGRVVGSTSTFAGSAGFAGSAALHQISVQTDAPFVRLGWQKDDRGNWQHPLARLRRQKDQEMLAKSCQLQDLEWVLPAEFEQWKQGLWKCGEQWLDTAAANTYHADANQPWYVASEHFVISTTVDRERVEWCKW